MDLNFNKNTGKRKAQSIHDMINASSGMGTGIKKSAYKGPKNVTSGINELSGSSADDLETNGKWGNSNEGMPEPKKQRIKSDVPNPMRGNLFGKSSKSNSPKGYIIQSGSNYSGPKVKRRRSADIDGFDDTDSNLSREKKKSANTQTQYNGLLDDVGYIIFCVILSVCVITTLVVSGLKPRKNSYTYPLNIFSMSGVINEVHESKMGISDTKENSALTQDNKGDEGTAYSENDNTKVVEVATESDLNKLGEERLPGELDDGTMSFDGYSKAASHDELVEQVNQALTDGNVDFIAAKFAYESEKNNELKAYPISVVNHFCEYMSGNADKRAAFITSIKKEEYAGKNGTAEIIKLPMMKFTIKLGENSDKKFFDNTVISVSGFSEQMAFANQNAAIYPLLPCFYDITITNNAWPTPYKNEVEARLGEGNLDINIGKDD